MQSPWSHDGDSPSERRESLKSSILRLQRSESDSDTTSTPSSQAEEEEIESLLGHAVNTSDAATGTSSRAGSPYSAPGYGESLEDQDFFKSISGHHDDGTRLGHTSFWDADLGFAATTAPEISIEPASVDPQSTVSRYEKPLGKSGDNYLKRITISDDHSVGSKIEERNLLALRERSVKAKKSLTDGFSRESDQPAFKASRRNTALQERQLQLMLLEQQNKKRLLEARQKQPVSSGLAGNSDNNMWTSASSVDIPQEIVTNGKNEHTIQTKLRRILERTDPSKLDLQKLQDYIELLQAQIQQHDQVQSERTPSRYQILYRIKKQENIEQSNSIGRQQGRVSTFFDPPEWVKGQDGAAYVRSNLPLENFDLYLEKNKDISFIVYRDFDMASQQLKVHPDNGQDPEKANSHVPQPSGETVRPVNKDLIQAMKILLSSQQEYSQLSSQFSVSLELPAPYLFIYHSRKYLESFLDGLRLQAKAQVTFLVEYIEKQFADEYATADSLLTRNKISPDYVRYLFKPGDVLVSRIEGQYRGFVSKTWPKIERQYRASRTQVVSRSGTTLPLYGSQNAKARMENDEIVVHVSKIDVWSWTFDGNFQRQNKALNLEIPAFRNDDRDSNGKATLQAHVQNQQSRRGLLEQNISDLNVYPIQYASPDIVDKCRRRGKVFWKCRSCSYVSYREADGETVGNSVGERYMIDYKTYRVMHPENKALKKELTDELGPEALARNTPPDEQFELLLPLNIKGYNLRRKKWFDLVADRISDVRWNKEAFQNLVIDRKSGDLIRALVSNQLAAEKGTDLIMGKGNGLILLLHGGPGTGKTLTAESVAEIAEKPLYRVTCGDVGTKAEEVEKYLESVLHLGKIWGCVVLLDEADVFLEQRSLEDMERNALVSVFLRVLEYYEGILILTSNRVGTFDEAFKSRIQLALHYPVLGPHQRLRIWENFFNRLESFGDTDKVDLADLRDHLEELKEEKLNGRQIRNAITTARQYAEWKGKTLNYSHLQDVIEVSGRFDKYLDRLNGNYTQDQLAQEEGWRLDQ